MADSWQVVGQRQSSVRDATGQFVDAMIVTFQTAKGNTGTVTVPISQYNPQNVHDLVSVAAANADAVSSLSSSNPPSSPAPPAESS